MTDRRIWLIADDYGLSPGVSRGILELLNVGRLSGTGCMTLFPEWADEAKALQSAPPNAAIGLHLTLTDQMACSGVSALAPQGKLPSLGRLALSTRIDRRVAKAAIDELDAQYARFVEEMGRAPDFVDGHQHVHFLPVVRRWLAGLADRAAPFPVPFVRGAPAPRYAPRPVMAKATVVRGIARGFDRFAAGKGLHVVGPLAGFYEWHDPTAFAAAMTRAAGTLPDNALFMCHPGHVDAVLKARDPLQAPRVLELEFLGSEEFPAVLQENGVALARIER